MKLWRPNEAPIGGWYFVIPENGRRVPMSGTSTGLDKLVRQVEDVMEGLEMEVPPYLASMVEDQICQRQPEDRCRKTKGLGDQVSIAIHAVAGIMDSALGTNIKQKAKRCGGCGKRRAALNHLTSR